MKSTLKVTSKGQVTFRKEILDQLGVKPGDKVTAEFVGPGRVELRSARGSGSINDFIGFLNKPGQPRLSLEDIKRLIEEGWAGKR
jgi:antitoxin PrlF